MSKMNRRRFLTVAGAGSVAAAAGAGATLTGLTGGIETAQAYSFRAAAALPTDRRFPDWGTYLVEGHVNPGTGVGSITRSVYAGRPDAMSHIALVSHVVRIEQVRQDGKLLHVKGVIDNRSHLLPGEKSTIYLTIDRSRGQVTTEFFGSPLTLHIQ